MNINHLFLFANLAFILNINYTFNMIVESYKSSSVGLIFVIVSLNLIIRLLFVKTWRVAIGINLFSIHVSIVVAEPPKQMKPLSNLHDWSQPSKLKLFPSSHSSIGSSVFLTPFPHFKRHFCQLSVWLLLIYSGRHKI